MDPKPPPMQTSPAAPLTPEWVAWINRAALEAVAADEGVAVDELAASVADNPVAWMFGNPLHQRLTQQLRRGNPTLFRRLIQAKALAPFVVWLAHQKDLREMELRVANVQEASSRAALETYGPYLGTVEDEEKPEPDEVEPGIEREMVEYLASLSR